MRIHEMQSWALSPKGNTLALYCSSLDALQNKANPLILIGGVHGDEPEGVELAQKTLDWLRVEVETKSRVPREPWIIIPCLNIDGYLGGTRTNGNGVDLNRNYPAKSWTSQYSGNRYFPGSHPGSEPEIKALVQLIDQTQPALVIHCHSWHPAIICAGPAQMPEALALAQATGYDLQANIGYPTPGSLSEYGWNDHGIPVICIEEQENVALSEVWPRFAPAMEAIFFNASVKG